MKVIRYHLNAPQTEGEQAQENLIPVTLSWSPANEELAAREAYKGLYTVEEDGRVEEPFTRIRRLKKQLSATDYQVIKCAECQLLGQAMPYDMAALHAQRQAIRDEINGLEGGQ